MKTFSKLIVISALMAGMSSSALVPAYADRNAPPDETATGDRISQIEAELQRLRDENAAREAREAAAAKRAEEQRRQAAERRARAERERKAREQEAARQKAFSDALNRGIEFVENGRYVDGLKALRDFAKKNPYSADAWYWIALAHNALGDYDRAQYAANIALEIDPYYPPLTKTPSGLEPMPKRTRQTNKEPRPSMSVLPVKPLLPINLALEPVTISFPVLRNGSHDVQPMEGDDVTSYYDGRDPVTGAWLEYLPYPPNEPGRTVAWQRDEKFTEISRWRFRVDRMGLLKDPQVPIAWRGSHPYEVYFWTGTEWARVRRVRVYYDHKETFEDTLAHAQESIRDLLDQKGYQWNPGDTPALAASASHMRYMWMGEIDLEPAHKRAEKLAAEHFIYDSWEPLEGMHEGGGEGGSRESSPESSSSPSSDPSSGGGGDLY